MRDKWYGDGRDLVKWSVLLLLARKYQADRVLQVAYYRPCEPGEIDLGGQRHPLPKEVLFHFRDMRKITALCLQPRIELFDLPFDNREGYLKAVKDHIGELRSERCLVFLDPDTGLEPKRKPDLRHVLRTEAHAIWAALPSGWVFVFYQHQTNRAGRPWVEEKRCQLAQAIGANVSLARGPEIAPDVVFYYAQK